MSDEVGMHLVGVEVRSDPIWQFAFSGTECYAQVEVHKNSSFALAFRDPAKNTINFNKKVKLVVAA